MIASINTPPSRIDEAQSLRVFVISGEPSGDSLGAGIMQELRRQFAGSVDFTGIGGPAMAAAGLVSLFPQQDITAMGFSTVLRRLPILLQRLRTCVRAVVARQPDLLLLIDSPDFTLRVARRTRAKCPHMAIVKYVSPSVWAWRPGRAPAMRAYVDHILALLPFEPTVHRQLGGPACTYVGHPLYEQRHALRPQTSDDAAARTATPFNLLLLPGSRRSELHHLLPPFRQAIEELHRRGLSVHVTLPTVPHLTAQLRTEIADWPFTVELVVGDEEKRIAFRRAHVALAASGTVTLELAVARIPTVVAYRGGWLEASIARRLVKVPSIVLANLVMGDTIMPELLQEQVTAEALADTLVSLIGETPARQRQLTAYSRIDEQMNTGERSPTQLAAHVALQAVAARSNAQ